MVQILLKYFMIAAWIIHLSDQASLPNSTYYVAGVVEFRPNMPKYANDTSAPDYIRIAQSTEAKDVDILVFPEMTLNTVLSLTYVPNPKDRVIPCGKQYYHDFFSSLSCVARNTSKYIVVNLIEKEDCTVSSQQAKDDPRPCSQNGLSQYNTNVAFDRKGAVISRYRKWNLYGEGGRNTTNKPEYGVFDTDFGVKFGHFICFDILFYTPAEELVARGITDFIFPSMWFSELPFLTAVQVQSAWAYTNDVNLLAAGANQASVGSSGTGIYAGRRGRIVASMTSNPLQKLYVARVSKKGSNATVSTQSGTNDIGTEYMFFKRDHLDSFNTSVIDPMKSTINETLCHGGLCCQFNIVLKNQTILSPISKSYVYRLAAYNGARTYGVQVEGFIKVCGVIACVNNTLASCGTIYQRNVTVENQFSFEQIVIEGTFRDSKMMFFMPVSLDFTFMPLNVNEITFKETKAGDDTRAVFSLAKPRSNLLTFATYVNILEKTNDSKSMKISLFVILMSLILTFMK